MSSLLKVLFFALIVRPLILLGLGVAVWHRERLPVAGPAIFVANHNSHLDTLLIMSLVPLRHLPRVRPMGAADYFFCNPVVGWLSRHVLGMIPLSRKLGAAGFREAQAALARGEMLIIFPEGSRGDPEVLSQFKGGVGLLAEKFPQTPVIPLYLNGLGKTLPRGSYIPIPFFCDVVVGAPLFWSGERQVFAAQLQAAITDLAKHIQRPVWD